MPGGSQVISSISYSINMYLIKCTKCLCPVDARLLVGSITLCVNSTDTNKKQGVVLDLPGGSITCCFREVTYKQGVVLDLPGGSITIGFTGSKYTQGLSWTCLATQSHLLKALRAVRSAIAESCCSIDDLWWKLFVRNCTTLKHLLASNLKPWNHFWSNFEPLGSFLKHAVFIVW